MKTKSKLLVSGIGAVLTISGTVLGTLAFLTDTESAVNTFTVGKVSIALNETDVDGDGNTLANEYHLIPGTEYIKDPTVTVNSGSEESYIRMYLTVHNYSTVEKLISDSTNGLSDFTDFLGGMDDTAWRLKGSSENEAENTITYEYRYKVSVAGGSGGTELEPLFDTLIIPQTLDGDELEALSKGGFQIDVEAHAIQASGFGSEDIAWEAFKSQTGK